MSAPFAVRPAKESDYETINALMYADDVEYAKEYPYAFKKPPSSVLRKGSFLLSLEADEMDWAFFVAESDNKVVGFMELNVENIDGNRIRKDRKVVSVDELTVHPKYRRHGIGTALMHQAEIWARDHKIDQIALQVYTSRPAAQALYNKLGYTTFSHSMLRELT